MAESDTALPKVKNGDIVDKIIRVTQTVGFPIVVAAFLLWEWHSVVRDLQDTLTQVKLLLMEVKMEMRDKK